MKALVISDLHIPFHAEDALKITFDYAKDEKVDTVILNGDILDCASVSKFEKNIQTPHLVEEIEQAKEFLTWLRRRFPNAKIYYRLGNHEERLEHYLMRHAEEIARLNFVTIGALLEVDKFGIKMQTIRQEPLWLGKLAVLHGHELRSGAGVNIAHTVLRKVMNNVLVGHWHRRQSETLKTYKGTMVGAWVVGCMCNLEPEYLPINQWQHGFAIVKVQKNGYFIVDNRIVVDGRVL